MFGSSEFIFSPLDFATEWAVADLGSKYGQPVVFSLASGADSDSEDEGVCSNPILHSFAIDPESTCFTGGARLNLGVGGDGVVGRTVSILDRRRGRILGQGVIGWD